jgi:drug/metabolite transporter (DMT)-like permease
VEATGTFRLGLAFAVASALSFGMSGPLGKALMHAGWTPTAAVTARLVGGALVLAIVATVVHRNWLREAFTYRRTVLFYGVIPIAGAQLCYYNAVAHMSVGVALLLEYLSPVLVVGWLWATTRHRPGNLTLAGVAMAIGGIMLVLNVFAGSHVDVVGVFWALAWLVPAIALAVVPTALAYTLGIMGIARLRPRFASLVGLTEVMAAVLWAWLLVGEAITASQGIGGMVVLLGLALARHGDRTQILDELPALPVHPEHTTAADRSV